MLGAANNLSNASFGVMPSSGSDETSKDCNSCNHAGLGAAKRYSGASVRSEQEVDETRSRDPSETITRLPASKVPMIAASRSHFSNRSKERHLHAQA